MQDLDQFVDSCIVRAGGPAAWWLLFVLASIIGLVWQTRHTRSTKSSAATKHFGRVSRQTSTLLSKHVSYIDAKLLSGLPIGASGAMRSLTVRLVLDYTLEDWWRNGNTSGLDASDLDDLRSFIQLAGRLSGPGYQLEDLAVYKTILTNLLEDWLHNWNAGGVDGPPAIQLPETQPLSGL